MSVSFYLSTQQGGSSLRNPMNFGRLANTGGTTIIEAYLSHSSPTPLYNCGFYLQPYVGGVGGGGYSGTYGESPDYLQFLNWGQNDADFKGFLVNMDPAATDTSFHRKFRSGTAAQGDNYANHIMFETNMVPTSTAKGHWPPSTTAQCAFMLSIPNTDTNAGRRYTQLYIRYEQ